MNISCLITCAQPQIQTEATAKHTSYSNSIEAKLTDYRNKDTSAVTNERKLDPLRLLSGFYKHYNKILGGNQKKNVCKTVS